MPDLEIIAEAAQGYEGDIGIAQLLVRAAAASGADAIKFQLIFADDVAVPGYKYYDLFGKLEMPDESWREIRNLAKESGLRFYADLSGPRSEALAEWLDVDGVKISTTSFFDGMLASRALKRFPRLLVSVGGIEHADIREFLDSLDNPGDGRLTLLHGFQSEPTPLDRNELARIATLRADFGIDVGFMDHSDGGGADTLVLSAMALALGVTVFEKHITLDHALALEDYVSGLPPTAFKAYVAALHRLAGAMGDGSVTLSEDEAHYREIACKRVVASRDLTAGMKLDADDVTLLRPIVPSGLFRAEDAIGRTLRRDIARHQPIEGESLK